MRYARIWKSAPDCFDGFAVEIIEQWGKSKTMETSIDTIWMSTMQIAIAYCVRNNLRIVYV